MTKKRENFIYKDDERIAVHIQLGSSVEFRRGFGTFFLAIFFRNRRGVGTRGNILSILKSF